MSFPNRFSMKCVKCIDIYNSIVKNISVNEICILLHNFFNLFKVSNIKRYSMNTETIVMN